MMDLDKILAKVQALLAHAENEGNTEEARAAYRAKAEELMRKYRVDSEAVIAQNADAYRPIRRDFVIASESSEFYRFHAAMFRNIARHCGVRYVYGYEVVAGKSYVYDVKATAVGYEGDVRYAEMLQTAARLAMIAKLEPKVDPAKSEADNVYALRNSGMARIDIAKLLWDDGSHANNAKVTRLYEQACAERGEPATVSGRSVNVKTYREVYARQFVVRFAERLRTARDAADSAGGGALVLHNREARVDEAFYEAFPEYRPQPSTGAETPTPTKCEKHEDCKRPPNHKGKCGDRKRGDDFRWTAADERRWIRENQSAAALAGKAAGTAAADSVLIERSANRADRVGGRTSGTAELPR